MSLSQRLYDIGMHVTEQDIKTILQTDINQIDNLGDYQTIIIDFTFTGATCTAKRLKGSISDTVHMITKKIGGTSNSYYLYPNLELQKESDVVKKFKSLAHTISNSLFLYSDSRFHIHLAAIQNYLETYSDDILELSSFEKGNYFLILTLEGKSFVELMPEVWKNYYDDFVQPHVVKKVKGIATPQLREDIDAISGEYALCGYNPDVKFFTKDNYHDAFKGQLIDALPLSKESAKTIKRGWMYALSRLKFFHKGLEYMILPSMAHYDPIVYKQLLNDLNSSKDRATIAAKETYFIRRLQKQIESFSSVDGIALDILFTEVNLTNLSVKIFATLEDVLPSRIRTLLEIMQAQHVSENIKHGDNEKGFIYLRDYFSREELFAIATNNMSVMKNRITSEKIRLAKILLGYERVDLLALKKAFEFHREFDFSHKKRIDDHGIKEWLNYPKSYVEQEERIVKFLQSIQALKLEQGV